MSALSEHGDDGGGPSRVASQRIADLIAERILSGELLPGTRIIQDDLAEELQSSRLPVREALRILKSRGLVTLRSNQGAWVSSMDLDDCQLSYRIRERVEPLLLAESLLNLTPQDIADLEDLQTRIEAGVTVDEFLVLDRQLHWAAYRGHQADQLTEIVERLWDTTQHNRRAFTQLSGSRRLWTINAEHRLLIQAIKERDVETAESMLTMHIRRTRIELSRHPELFASPTP